MSSDTSKAQDAGEIRKAKSLEARLLAASKTKPASADNRLTKLYRHEADLLGEVRGILDSLKSQMIRVKTEGVRENVEKITALFDVLVKSRDDIKAEYRVRSASERTKAETSSTETKVADRVAASEAKILEALAAVNKRLDTQDAIINGRAQHVVPGENTSAPWTEVVKKPARAKPLPAVAKPGPVTTVPRVAKSLPRAVVIKRGDASFADTVKNIRRKIDAEAVGDAISKVRETRNGNVLIEVLGGSDKAEAVRKEVEKSLGPGESVRSLEPRSLLQLRDLDCVTNGDDIMEAIARKLGTGAEDVKVLSVRPTYGGEQSALVLVPSEAAAKLIAKGRIRVGMINSRVREAQKITRWFRCFEEGHEFRNCKGADRSKDC